MSDNSYERYAKIRDLKGLTDYKVAKLGNIKGGTAPISNWKNGKYILKKDKMQSIANVLNVSLDYLNGETDEIVCKECGFNYNPLNEFDCACHENMHNKILEAKSRFQFLIPYNEKSKMIATNLIEIRNNSDKFWDSIKDYLKAKFSEFIYNNYDKEDNFDYDDFCKTTIIEMIQTGDIPSDKVDSLLECYKIDKDKIDNISAMMARISKNPQMIRILNYLEKLSPDSLENIEIYVKALSEKDK